MNGDGFLEMAVLAVILVCCLYATVRFVGKIFGRDSAGGCSGCSEVDACEEPQKEPPPAP